MSDFDQAAAADLAVEANARNLEDYLNCWGLGMYIDKFKEQCVDLDTLQILMPEDLKELAPVIGHRAKLTTQIAMLKHIVTDAFPEDNNTELYKLLCSSNEGRGLLLQYLENGLLTNAARRRLCNIIISNDLSDHPEKCITSSRLYQLGNAIAQIFKKESASVYFTPFSSFSPLQKISAKGKLLDCYRQRRRAFMKTGLIKGKEKTANSSPAGTRSNLEIPGPSTSVQDVTLQLPESADDLDDKMLWLKNCTDPWETVEEYWSITTKIRLTLLQSNKLTIQQYYGEFKALNQPGGIFLLLKDFKSLYPDNDQKLMEDWLPITPKIVECAKTRSIVQQKGVLEDIISKTMKS